MTYDQYLSKREELTKQIELLGKEYIEEHRPYNYGDIVDVSYNYGKFGNTQENKYRDPVRGVIVNFNIDYNGKVIPIAKKLKKDGTRANAQLYIYHSDKIEVISNGVKQSDSNTD